MTGSVAARPGRNEPCPCGSGKKFKHCCMGGNPAVKAVSVARLVQEALHYHRSGKVREAEMAYERVLKQDPDNVDALHLLGVLASHGGRHDEAVARIGRAIEISPNIPALYLNLGNVYQMKGDLELAIASFQRALALKPDFAEAHLNLGNAFQAQKAYDSALSHYEKALAIKPDHPDILMNMGNVLQAQHRWNNAVAYYDRVIALRPDSAEAFYNMGKFFQAQERLGEAESYYQQALHLKPTLLEAYLNLAQVWNSRGRFKDASAVLAHALSLKPDSAEAEMNLGGVYMAQGRMEEAIAHYERATQMDRAYAVARSNLLLATQYASHLTLDEVLVKHRAFGVAFEGESPHFAPHANTPRPKRKLRIGYVSPDFRRHSVAYFAEAVFALHSRAGFEVYGYYNHYLEDEVTERFRGYCDHWRNINEMGDAEVEHQIRQDGIDILVDLAGHTGRNRLSVFALKPAPVQITWLGHPNTTGLKTMDFRITDPYAEPKGMTEHLNTEALWRLPEVFCCYTPCAANPDRRGDEDLAVQPAPMLRNGFVTFGSFNNIAKVSPQTVALWSRVMKAVPHSRLLLEAWWLDSPELQEQLIGRFAAHGIEADRLIMKPRTPEQQYVLYHEVDIALDPFPCTGGTTTFDALWMGVPVVTLAGRAFVSRMGVSLLSNLDEKNLIAESEDDYVRIVQDLIADPDALNRLRLGQRERMECSPLMDAPRFVKNMEKAYRAMWKQWCEKEAGV